MLAPRASQSSLKKNHRASAILGRYRSHGPYGYSCREAVRPASSPANWQEGRYVQLLTGLARNGRKVFALMMHDNFIARTIENNCEKDLIFDVWQEKR